jgi:hypothetical protein
VIAFSYVTRWGQKGRGGTLSFKLTLVDVGAKVSNPDTRHDISNYDIVKKGRSIKIRHAFRSRAKRLLARHFFLKKLSGIKCKKCRSLYALGLV